MATKSTFIILNKDKIYIWVIPPLSPQPLDFFDHHPTYIPPRFIIPIPNDIEISPEYLQWNTISSWYFGSSQPLYCDLECSDSTIHRFQIIIDPNLITASLRVINTSEISPHYLRDVYIPEHMICEDTLVSYFINRKYNPFNIREYQTGLCTGLTTHSGFSNGIISRGGPAANMLLPDMGGEYNDLFPCPASGRFVRVNSSDSDSITVHDFF